MNMKNTKTKYNNEKGQTLLFVIVAVTIAMAVGVSVSTRTIQSLKRVARTDTSARVIAAAEGGIENLLSKTYSQLDQVADRTPDDVSCASIGARFEESQCVYYLSEGGKNNEPEPIPVEPEPIPVEPEPIPVEPEPIKDPIVIPKPVDPIIDPITTPSEVMGVSDTAVDLISSRAVVKVEKITFDEGEEFSFNLEPGLIKEVNLDTYSEGDIKICWDFNQSAIYYYSYNSDGEVLKGGLKPNGTPPSFMNLSTRFTDSPETESGYDHCKTVSLVDDSYGLRIKVLYNNSKVAVFPTSGSLPTQGYKFTSVGEIVTGSGSEEKATVIVHKSYPYAPDIFDYGIYTPATLQ